MKTWLPAEDELLLQLQIRQWNHARIAARFGCAALDVTKRLEQLAKLTETLPPPPEPPKGQLATLAEIEAMKEVMNPLQRAFMDHCVNYNALGATMKFLSECASQCLEDVELEKVLIDCLEQPRQSGETVAQKIARELRKRCIVILIPVEPAQPKQPNAVTPTTKA